MAHFWSSAISFLFSLQLQVPIDMWRDIASSETRIYHSPWQPVTQDSFPVAAQQFSLLHSLNGDSHLLVWFLAKHSLGWVLIGQCCRQSEDARKDHRAPELLHLSEGGTFASCVLSSRAFCGVPEQVTMALVGTKLMPRPSTTGWLGNTSENIFGSMQFS